MSICSEFRPGNSQLCINRYCYRKDFCIDNTRCIFKDALVILIPTGIKFNEGIIVRTSCLNSRGAVTSSIFLIATIVIPGRAGCCVIGSPPGTYAGIHAAGAEDSITQSEVRPIGQQAAVEGGRTVGVQQNFLRRRRSEGGRRIVDQQVTVGETRCFESDVLVGPVGLVHSPDARHTRRRVGRSDRCGSEAVAIVIAPNQEGLVGGDGLTIRTIAGGNTVPQSNRDKLTRVDTFTLLLMQYLTIIAAQTGDIGFESSVDGSIPHFGGAIARQIVPGGSLIQGDTVFQGQITFNFLHIGNRHRRGIAIDDDF